MTSYLAKKEHVFLDADRGEPELAKKRSEGRMKTYGSATDIRAWCTTDEERRRYILDLIKGPNKKNSALGNFIPVETLIELLLANKNADIEKLQKKIKQLKKLLDIYESLDLTACQQNQVNNMKAQMLLSADDLSNISESMCSEDPCSTFRSYRSEGTSTARSYEPEPETSGVCQPCKAPVCPPPPKAPICLPPPKVPATKDAACGVPTCKPEPIPMPECGSDDAHYEDHDRCTLIRTLEDRDHEIRKKRDLALKAIQQLESLKFIMEERDQLKQQLRQSQLQICTLKCEKKQMAKSIACCPRPSCEINALEAEITRLRDNCDLTPEQETEIIRKELDILKKYCDKLSNIQEENDMLKRELDHVKGQIGRPCIKEQDSEKEVLCRALETKLHKSNEKIAELEACVCQAKESVMKSEEFLRHKRRSEMLDCVVAEKNDLARRLDVVGNLQDKLNKITERANEADCMEKRIKKLQSEIEELQKYKKKSETQAKDICCLKKEKDRLNKAIETANSAREDMQNRLNDLNKYVQECQTAICERNMLQAEIEPLREKAQEADVLALERDRLILRIEELSSLEIELLQLVDVNEAIVREKDEYRRKNCDYECVVADQEDEIRQLVLQIDILSMSCEKQKDKLTDSLKNMRLELEYKKEEVQEMEENLQNTISVMSNSLNEKENEINKLKDNMEKFKENSMIEAEHYQSTIKTLKYENTEKESTLQCLKREKCKEMTDTQNAIEMLNIKIEECEKYAVIEAQKYQQTIKELRTEILCKDNAIIDLKYSLKAYEANETETHDLQATIEAMKAETSEKDCAIQQAKVQFAICEKSSVEEANRLQLTISSMCEEIADKEMIITQLRNKVMQTDINSEPVCKPSCEAACQTAGKSDKEGCKPSCTAACQTTDYTPDKSVCELICMGHSKSGGETKDQLKKLQRDNEHLQQLVNQLKNVCKNDHIGILLSETKEAVGILIKEIHDNYRNGLEMDIEMDNKITSTVCITDEADSNTEQLSEALKIAKCEIRRLKLDLCTLRKVCDDFESDRRSEAKRIRSSTSYSDSEDISLLTCALDACKCNEERLETENKALRKHSMDMQDVARQKIHDLTQQLKEALKKCESMQTGTTSTQEELAETCARCSTLETQIEAYEAKIKILKTQMKNLVKDLCCKDKTADITNHMQMLLENILQDHTRTSDAQNKNKHKVAELTEQLQKAYEKCAQLEKQMAQSQSNVMQAKMKCDFEAKNACSEIRKLKRQCEELKNTNIQLTNKTIDLTEQLQNIGSKSETCDLENVRSTKSVCLEVIDNLRQKVENLQNEKKQLDKQFKEFRFKTQGENFILQGKIKEMEETAKDKCDVVLLSSMSYQFEEEKILLKEENEKLKQIVIDTEKYIFDIIDSQDNEKEEMCTKNCALQKYVAGLEKTISINNETIAKYKEQAEQLKSILKQRAGAEITSCNENAGGLQELKGLKENIKCLECKLNKETSNNDQLKELNYQLEAKIGSLESKLQKKESEFCSERQKLHVKIDSHDAEMNETINKYCSEIQHLKELNNELKAKFESVEAELNKRIQNQQTNVQLTTEAAHICSACIQEDDPKKIIEQLTSEIKNLKLENECLKECVTQHQEEAELDRQIVNQHASPHKCSANVREDDSKEIIEQLIMEIENLKSENQCLKVCAMQNQNEAELNTQIQNQQAPHKCSANVREDESKEIIEQLITEIENLKAENQCLKVCAIQNQDEAPHICSANVDKDDSKKNVKQLITEIEDLKVENQCLKTCLMQMQGDEYVEENENVIKLQVEKLKDEIRCLRICYDVPDMDQGSTVNLECRVDELEKQVQGLQCNLDDTTKEKEHVCGLYKDSLQRTASMASEIDKLCSMGDSEERNKYLLNKVKDLKQTCNSKDERITSMRRDSNAVCEDYENKLRVCAAAENELENKLMKTKGTVSCLEGRVKELETCNTDLEKRFAQCRRDSQELADKYQDSIRRSSLQETKLEAELLKAKSKNNVLGSSADDLKKEIERLRTENERLTGKLEMFMPGEDVSMCSAMMQTDMDQNQALQNLIKLLEAKIAKLEAEGAGGGGGGGVPTAEMDDCLEKLKALQAENKKLREGQGGDADLLDKINALEAENKKLREGQGGDADLLDKLKALEAENKKLKDGSGDMAGLMDQIKALEAENKKLKDASADLQSKIQGLEDANKKLKDAGGDMASLMDKIKSLENENNSLKEQGGNSAAELAEALKKLKALEAELKDMKDKGGNAAADLAAALSKIQSLEAANKDLKDKADAAASAASAALADALNKLKAAEDEKSKLQGSLDSAKKDSGALAEKQAKQIEDYLAKIKALEDANKKLTDSLADANKSIEKFSNQAKEMANQEKELADNRAQIQALQDELKALRDKLANAEKDSAAALAKQAKDLADAMDKLKGMEAENKSLQDKLKKAEEESGAAAAKLAKELADAQAKLKQAEADNNKLKGDIDQMKASKGKEADELAAKLKALQAAFDAEKKKAEEMGKLLEAEKKSKEALEKSLADEKKKKEDMEKALAAQIQKQKDMEAENKKNMDLLKEQYDRDIQYTKGRHSDGIAQLQNLHEEQVETLNKDFEKEVSAIQVQAETTAKELKRASQELEKERRKSKELQKKIEPEVKPDVTKPDVTKPDVTKPDVTSTCVQTEDPPKGSAVITEIKYNCPCKSGIPGGKMTLTKKTLILTNVIPERMEDMPELEPEAESEQEPEPEPVPTKPARSIDKIFTKAIQLGLENLSFEELSTLHSRTCLATSHMLGTNPDMSFGDHPEKEDESDKISLMRQIAILENEMSHKHRYAENKINALEYDLRNDRHCLHEVKQTLSAERKRNSELMARISVQSRESANVEVERDLLKRQSTYHEDRLQKLIVGIETERSKLKKLEEDLTTEKLNNQHLKALLQSERERQHTIKSKANETIEAMRYKLEKALDTESELRMKLGYDNKKTSRSFNASKTAAFRRPTSSIEETFTTDLTVASGRRKRNVIHHCKIRRCDDDCK